jgi:hypothetical protein
MTGLSASDAARAAVSNLVAAWTRGWAALAPAAVLLAAARALGKDPLGPLLFIGAALWIIQAQAVCYRLALGPPAPALAGSRVTRDVPRLVIVAVLQVILLGIITGLMLTVVGAVAYGAASVGKGFSAAEPATWLPAMGPTGRLVSGTVAVAGLAGVAWVVLRLAFSAAATVDRQAVQVLSAWPLTKGRVLASFAASIISSIPTLAAAWGLDQAGMLASAAGGLVVGLVAIGVTLPLHAGLMTYLYRHSPTD